MASYYYLVASLPMLHFEENPSISMERFLDSCEQSMGTRDYSLVRDLATGNLDSIKQECAFLTQWNNFIVTLKQSLHEARALALSRS